MIWLCLWYGALLIMSAGATRCPQEYLDTGQSQNFLAVEATVDGTLVDLQGGMMVYCPNQPTTLCMITCTIKLITIHSPSYAINGGCFSAGGNGDDLQEVVVNVTNSPPSYTIFFQCRNISTYRCVFNDTLYSQEVSVQEDAAACGNPDLPTNISTSPPLDGGNTTNGTTIMPRPPDIHGGPWPITAGAIGLVILIVIITITLAVIVVVYRKPLRTQGSEMLMKVCSYCCAQQHMDSDGIKVPIPVVDSESETEMVPGVSVTVEGGGGQQWYRPISVSRPTY